MIRQFFSVLTILLSFGIASAQTPIVISKLDMPVAGKPYAKNDALPTADMQLDKSGPKQFWDYSDLQPTGKSADTFKTMSQVSPIYKLYLSGVSPNLVLPNDIDLGLEDVIPLAPQDMMAFLKSDNSAFSVVGLGFTMQGFPLGIAYEKPDLMFTFPLTYEKEDSSFSAFTFTFPSLIYYHRDQMRRWKADAWGTIKTPIGTYEAIRVRTELEMQDTIYLDTLGNGILMDLPPTVEYTWLTKGLGQAVMTISGSDVDGNFVPTSVSYLDTIEKPKPNGIYTPEGNINGFAAWPNPVVSELRLFNTTALPANAVITDLNGRVIWQGAITPGSTPVAMAHVKAGAYFISISNEKHIFRSKVLKAN